MENVQFRPVVYDELQIFSESNANYPFQGRKSNIPSVVSRKEDNNNLEIINIYLQKNVVCYDKDIFSELFFWKSSKCDIDDTS